MGEVTEMSRHWRDSLLVDERLRAAAAELSNPKALESLRNAFTTMLHSDSTAAVGIALDYYRSYEAMGRHGYDNPFEDHDDDVVRRARELLGLPPVSPSDEPMAKEFAANHASALDGLMNLAEPEDADLLAQVLRTASTSNVRLGVALAAVCAFEDNATPSEPLIDLLGELAADPSADYHARSAAVSSLGVAESKRAFDALLRVADADDESLCRQAARVIAESAELGVAGFTPTPGKGTSTSPTTKPEV
ncbi:hypothetical protein OG216_40050 [Streptomycetaceae bacterium NBC_01309]